MIKVKVEKENDQIKKVIVKGHSGYAENGHDIVCSSVSSIVITSVNAMLRFDENSVKANHVEGLIEVEILKSTKENKILLENMLSLLKELTVYYQKYIKFEE